LWAGRYRSYKGLDKAVEKALDRNPQASITTVKGVDMNRRNLAVKSNTQGKCRFYPSGHRRHLAKRVPPVDEVRCKRRAFAEPHAMVVMEWLKAIRHRTECRHSEKVSVKRRKVNRKGSTRFAGMLGIRSRPI
jgi:hypothetical protein